MSEVKFTPGPWHIGAYESGRMAVDGANGAEVTGYIDPEDAYLIAAAPTLYRALSDLIAYCDPTGEYQDDELVCARDALKKARGEI